MSNFKFKRIVIAICLFLFSSGNLWADTELPKVKTEALKMTGMRSGKLVPQVGTATLKMTGMRSGKLVPQVGTATLKMTGLRSGKLVPQVGTAVMKMTGLRSGKLVPQVGTAVMKMTGLRSGKLAPQVGTPTLKMTGMRAAQPVTPLPQTKKITTYPLEMTGTRVKLITTKIGFGKFISKEKEKEGHEVRTVPEEGKEPALSRTGAMRRIPAARVGAAGAPGAQDEEEFEIR